MVCCAERPFFISSLLQFQFLLYCSTSKNKFLIGVNVDSSLSLTGTKDGSDKEISLHVNSHAPSRVSSKSNEKLNSSIDLVEGPVTGKGHGEPQAATSHGRPGSSASTRSDRAVAVAASCAPGLSPSSSVGSLSSEKSTLNPHAKVHIISLYIVMK